MQFCCCKFLGTSSERSPEAPTNHSVNRTNNLSEDGPILSSIDSGNLRNFYSRKATVTGSDTDDTSDDEFILYVDDDKKYILK